MTRTLAAGLGAMALIVACHKVPYTNRKQFNLVPNGVMNQAGAASYTSMLADVRVQKQGSDNEVLQRVGRNISRVANQPNYDWTYSLIQSNELNAWALPGGYIGFYSGILPVLDNESGMAFVMGHEVAHATARHGAERLSQQLALFGGLLGLEVLLNERTQLKPEQRAVLLGALGVGGQLAIVLPFSRTHESEADVIGMMYMAKAGYPPAESIQVWDRMEQLSGSAGPEFLSTHPSYDRRRANLQEWLPNAKKKYARNKRDRDTLVSLWGGSAGRKGGR